MKFQYQTHERLVRPNKGIIIVTPSTTLNNFIEKCEKLKAKNEKVYGIYVISDSFEDENFISNLRLFTGVLQKYGFGIDCYIEALPNREFSSKDMENIITLEGLLNDQNNEIIKSQKGTGEKSRLQANLIGSDVIRPYRPNMLMGQAPAYRSSKVLFMTNMTNWSIEEVVRTNKILASIKEETKELSPLEKVMYIYSFLTDFEYKEGEALEDTCFSIYGLFNTGYVVCESYANLFEIMCRNVGVDAICSVELDRSRGVQRCNHMSVIAKVDDPKYGINGYYKCDPTLDSVMHPKNEYQSLQAFLFPVKYSECLSESTMDDVVYNLTAKSNKFQSLYKCFMCGYFDFFPFKSENQKASLIEKMKKYHRISKPSKGKNNKQEKKVLINEIENEAASAIDYEKLGNSPLIESPVIINTFKKILQLRLANAQKARKPRLEKAIRKKLEQLDKMEESLMTQKILFNYEDE